MTPETQTITALNAALILFLIGMQFNTVIDPYIQKTRKCLLIADAAVIVTLLIQNQILEYAYMIGSRSRGLFTFLDAYGYAARPLVIILLLFITKPGIRKWPFIVVVTGNALLYFSAFFTPLAFGYTDDFHFVPGPLGAMCLFISLILLVVFLIIVIREFWSMKNFVLHIPFFSFFVIIASVVMDQSLSFNPRISFLTVAMTFSCVFYYTWLHLQYVNEHEKDLLAQQRIKIMISQIQPHFLFNTLSAIQSLCETDPEKASDTIEKFGSYLRQNINSLNEPELIGFEKELEHTRTYAEIEMMRFPRISVEYDIKDTDFKLPALSVQPLVENAIRHGIRGKRRGIVKVSTYRDGTYHVINISDNGKGFDAAKLLKETDSLNTGIYSSEDPKGHEYAHVGINNVRERIEKMCAGTFYITSTPGSGTEITIRLP